MFENLGIPHEVVLISELCKFAIFYSAPASSLMAAITASRTSHARMTARRIR